MSATVNRLTIGFGTLFPTLISHLYAIPVSPHSLVKKTTNLYGLQRPMIDRSCRSY